MILFFRKTILVIIFSFFSFCIQSTAQVNADLELQVLFPTNNQTISYGDTVLLQLALINHGPEDVLNDTLLLSNNNGSGAGYLGDLLMGDTGIVIALKQWSGNIENDTIDICYYFQNPVSYSNRVADNNAANDSACVRYIMLGSNTVSVSEILEDENFLIFPNPATQKATISFGAANKAKVLNVSVFDAIGRKCFFQPVYTQNSNAIHLDLSLWASGVYFIIVDREDKRLIKKLFVIK